VTLPTTPPEPAWPTEADVLAQLGITADPAPAAVSVALRAAIDGVQFDTGLITDTPPAGLWSAALLAAVIAVKAPDAPFGVAAVFDVGALYVARQHPSYIGLLRGYRLSFGVA
jgi:hypothetical protein